MKYPSMSEAMTLSLMHEYYEWLLSWRDAYVVNIEFSKMRGETKRVVGFEIEMQNIDDALKSLGIVAFG